MKLLSYILIAFLIIGLLSGFLWKVPQWQAESQRKKINIEDIEKLEPKDRIQLEKDFAGIENNARTTLAQIIGGIIVLLGLYLTFQNVRVAQENARIAQKNVSVTEEGKITDRFSKAVELLGSEKLEIRLGGIYALERIARDSQKDHWTVMEVLTAFVRENAEPQSKEAKAEKDRGTSSYVYREKPREDIQAIMTIIGRRKWIETEPQKLNLQGVYLAGCELTMANLASANLYEANLNGASLEGANLVKTEIDEGYLIKANLRGADLTDASLFYADLTGAKLEYANLKDTSFCHSILVNASLLKAFLEGANLEGAVLATVQNLTSKQLISAKNYEKAKFLPSDLVKEVNNLKEEQSKNSVNKNKE